MKEKLLIVFLVITLYGCENGELVFNDSERQVVKEKVRLRGEKRESLFITCMALASQIQRQADDDVSDIVDSCSNESYYMTNYIK